MFTQRRSISAVCGYSSLSIMFLSNASAISRSASGSIQVVTKVAMFSRELPSSSSSSWISRYTDSGELLRSGILNFGIGSMSSRHVYAGDTTDSDSGSFLETCLCTMSPPGQPATSGR